MGFFFGESFFCGLFNSVALWSLMSHEQVGWLSYCKNIGLKVLFQYSILVAEAKVD